MKHLITAIALLCATYAMASYSPQTIITDGSTGNTATVTNSKALLVDTTGAPVYVVPSPGFPFPVTVVSSVPISTYPSPTATWPVSGTFWQGTQPVSIASPVVVAPSPGATFAVSGTFYQGLQPVSVASSIPISTYPSPTATWPVAIASSAPLTIVGQRPFEASVTITRPANTTTYSAGQCINSATSGLTAFPTFALGIGNSQKFYAQSIRLASTNGSTATKLQAAIGLWNTASPSGGGFNDAAVYNPTAAALTLAGNVFFENIPNSYPTGGTAAYVFKGDEYNREGSTDSSGNVYVALIAENAYPPISGEVFTIVLKGVE